MANEYTTKSLTQETLEKYTKKVLLPEIKDIVDERMQHYTNKILDSNDKVIKELKPLREEQEAIDENYKQLDKRVATLEGKDVENLNNTLERVNPWPQVVWPYWPALRWPFYIPHLDINPLTNLQSSNNGVSKKGVWKIPCFLGSN